MASGNRVEELETRVKELEATVSGLTDELVEAKDRIRTLEAEVDPDVDSSGDIIAPEPDAMGTSAGTGASSTDDEAETGAEGDKTRGDDGEDNGESGLDDDIIVA